MRNERFALAGREREEQAGCEAGEGAGEDGGEDDPEERVQAVGMLARREILSSVMGLRESGRTAPTISLKHCLPLSIMSA